MSNISEQKQGLLAKKTVDTSVSFPVKQGTKALHLKNPIMTASGTFGSGLEFMPYGDLTSLGGIVVKGLSLKPREGNPMPRVAQCAAGMLNAVGLQNNGIEHFLEHILPKLPWEDCPIVVNMYATSIEDFAKLASLLEGDKRIAAFELNISCPNVLAGGVLFGQDPALASKVCSAVKEAAPTMPLIVKLTPNVTDIAAIAKALEAAGADILSCINTLQGMAVDARTRRPKLANIVGGLSGPAIKPVALRCVWQVAKAVSIPVIGLGGIVSALDVLEFLLVGAHAVQIGTANFIRPDAAFRLAEELPLLCEELGIASLDEYRGSLKEL